MRTFQDIKDSGIGDPKIFFREHPGLDELCRLYNNLWGAISDTHMSYYDENYIITGNRVGCKDYFENLLNSTQPIYPLGVLSIKSTFSDIMNMNNLKGKYINTNNQISYLIWKSE